MTMSASKQQRYENGRREATRLIGRGKRDTVSPPVDDDDDDYDGSTCPTCGRPTIEGVSPADDATGRKRGAAEARKLVGKR